MALRCIREEGGHRSSLSIRRLDGAKRARFPGRAGGCGRCGGLARGVARRGRRSGSIGRGGLDVAGLGVGSRAGGCRVRGVDGNRRARVELRVRAMSRPGCRRTMCCAHDGLGPDCPGRRSRAEIGRHARGQLRKAEVQESGNAASEDRRDADFRAAGGPPCSAGAQHDRHDSDHHHERDGKTADSRCARPSIEPAAGLRACRGIDAVGRRLERIVNGRRALAPKILGSGRRLFGVLGRGSGSERDELVAGAEPVSREANHVGSRTSLLLS